MKDIKMGRYTIHVSPFCSTSNSPATLSALASALALFEIVPLLFPFFINLKLAFPLVIPKDVEPAVEGDIDLADARTDDPFVVVLFRPEGEVGGEKETCCDGETKAVILGGEQLEISVVVVVEEESSGV